MILWSCTKIILCLMWPTLGCFQKTVLEGISKNMGNDQAKRICFVHFISLLHSLVSSTSLSSSSFSAAAVAVAAAAAAAADASSSCDEALRAQFMCFVLFFRFSSFLFLLFGSFIPSFLLHFISSLLFFLFFMFIIMFLIFTKYKISEEIVWMECQRLSFIRSCRELFHSSPSSIHRFHRHFHHRLYLLFTFSYISAWYWLGLLLAHFGIKIRSHLIVWSWEMGIWIVKVLFVEFSYWNFIRNGNAHFERRLDGIAW